MSSENNAVGIGAMKLLGILFVGLKLTHFIDWSWWWVTAPFWGSAALIFVLIFIGAIVAVVKA